MYYPIARYDGYCVSCDAEQPLVLIERGPRGLRAWLSGISHLDRTLSYTCLVCGRVEPVPLTEAEDVEYEATLSVWPDWNPVSEPAVPAVLEPVAVAPYDVFALAAVRLAQAPVVVELTIPAPRRPVVTIVTLPVQRVEATDGQLLALSVA